MPSNTITPQKLILSIAILFLISYGLFNSRFILRGPEIAIAGLEEDKEVIETTSKDFSLQGIATHSSYITINNRPILVDEFGNFNEKLLLSNGVSIIDIYARDKFGKEVRKKIDVVYTGEDTSSSTEQIEQIALRTLSASSTIEEMEESESTNTDTATSTSENVIPAKAGIQ
ncbi:MAG: hypothetical protein RLZZ517_201 [Candidatus Parcubacteria bacterium]|jgi:hypothetical protein